MSTHTRHRTKRTRRTGLEIRSRLLEAGLEVFAERGYAGASTKEISRRAEVAEVLLFRHFGSKERLFDEAVLIPFEQFIDAYSRKWAGHGAVETSMEDLVREYVEILYGFFEQNRLLFDALLAAKAHHPSAAVRLEELFGRLQKIVRDAAVEFGLPVRNFALTTRLSFGLIMSAALHSDMLFATEQPLPRDTIVGQLCGYLLHGIASGPTP